MTSIENKPPTHIVIDEFISREDNQHCFEMIQQNEREFADSTVRQGAVNVEQRRSKSFNLPTEYRSLFLDSLRAGLTEIFNDLKMNQPEKLKFEIQSVAHGDGDYYKTHVDTFTRSEGGGTRRLISGVYYLHDEPKAFSGGQLRLYSISKKTHVDIEPLNGRIVLFPSIYPHEVLPTYVRSKLFSDSRFSITIWVNEDVASQTARTSK